MICNGDGALASITARGKRVGKMQALLEHRSEQPRAIGSIPCLMLACGVSSLPSQMVIPNICETEKKKKKKEKENGTADKRLLAAWSQTVFAEH